MNSSSKQLLQVLNGFIQKEIIPPFVYTYPTRASYRELSTKLTTSKIWTQADLVLNERKLNLYIHIPFCRYKCGFCNLYTITSHDKKQYTEYIKAVAKQLQQHKDYIRSKRLVTIYFGGGTPTLLSADDFKILFDTITDIQPDWKKTVEEVGIEASPDSIVNNSSLISDLMSMGLDRINIGIQSLKKEELREMGRAKANKDIVHEALDIVKAKKIKNLSTDLIMGFSGQTNQSWSECIEELAKIKPDTITTYFLTLRPDAWFSKSGDYYYNQNQVLYERYDIARFILQQHGYQQDTHIQYKLMPNGGYLQQEYHWQSIPVLGVGLGARSYNDFTDYIVMNDEKERKDQLSRYIADMNTGEYIPKYGFVYNQEERFRKRFVMNMFKQDLSTFSQLDLKKYAWIYVDLIEFCQKIGLIQKNGSMLSLTALGHKYRDIISWMFFSDTVRNLDKSFYMELHEKTIGNAAQPGDPTIVVM